MVKLCFTSALLVAALSAVCVAAASIPNLEILGTRRELAKIIEARDIAYLEYEARELELGKRTSELEARGLVNSEDFQVLFRRTPFPKDYKKKVLNWLQNADGAFQFGIDDFVEMHSGTTSRVPYCRPLGSRSTIPVPVPATRHSKATTRDEYEYHVIFKCKYGNRIVPVVPDFVIARTLTTDPHPTAKYMYQELARRVQAL